VLSPPGLQLASDLVDEYEQVKPRGVADPASLSTRELAGCWILTMGLHVAPLKFNALPRKLRRQMEKKNPGFQRLLELAAAGDQSAPRS